MIERLSQTIETYNNIAQEYSEKIQNEEPQEEIRKFTSHLEPGSKILDAGCAAGRDSKIFWDLGFDVVGVDLSTNLLNIARKNVSDISFIQADFKQLPFPSFTFDGIWLNRVFHHLEREDMNKAISELKRVLSFDGVIFVQTKEGSGTITVKEELSSNKERQFALVTQEELDNMFESSGFQKIDSYSNRDKNRDLTWVNGFYRKI